MVSLLVKKRVMVKVMVAGVLELLVAVFNNSKKPLLVGS